MALKYEMLCCYLHLQPIIMPSVRRLDWSPKKRATAITLRKEGYSYREIAAKIGLGVSPAGVLKVCKRFAETGTIKNKAGRGRKKVTTPQTDRRIVRLALKNRKTTSADINNALADSGVAVSGRTVRRRLVTAGLRARIPRKKPFLNPAQRLKRLQWAKKHVNWTNEQWKNVLWSDETRISIFGSDGVRYVRRRPGEDCLPECTTATMKHPLSIMVWGCMSRNSVGRLQVLNGTVNADKYIEEVLEPKLLPSARDIFGDGEPFIFQQDGAPCHTAKKCIAWCKKNKVELLDWPGNSPDLNPIENLWARLKRAVAAKRPSNKRQLIEAVVNSWYHIITRNELQQLVDSMPRRCEAVVKAKGYPTRY